MPPGDEVVPDHSRLRKEGALRGGVPIPLRPWAWGRTASESNCARTQRSAERANAAEFLYRRRGDSEQLVATSTERDPIRQSEHALRRQPLAQRRGELTDGGVARRSVFTARPG